MQQNDSLADGQVVHAADRSAMAGDRSHRQVRGSYAVLVTRVLLLVALCVCCCSWLPPFCFFPPGSLGISHSWSCCSACCACR